MKTKCPMCCQINDVDESLKNRTVTCAFCEHEFTAEFYAGALSGKHSPDAGIPRRPGDGWCIFGIVAGLLGGLCFIGVLLDGNAGAALLVLICTFIFSLLAITLGVILNRLDEITRHIELLRKEIRSKDPQ